MIKNLQSDEYNSDLSLPLDAALPSGLRPQIVIADVSDLIFYIGHHDHLTGIQRLQAELIETFRQTGNIQVEFICFDRGENKFNILEKEYLFEILDNFKRPTDSRNIEIQRDDAKVGRLPNSRDIFELITDDYDISIVLLGAAWVIPDYFRHINILKRQLKASYSLVLHDLIPIYARETCHQGTANVFRNFINSAKLHVDSYICVSKSTDNDLKRYFRENYWAPPQSYVVPHANEVLTEEVAQSRPRWIEKASEPFVLLVSTIEGRKNHILALAVWKKLKAEFGEKTPKLICIGRAGWRSEDFLLNYRELGSTILIKSDVSDQELSWLYSNCLFTIYPSLYEGWGLPISESLAYGKLCISSNTSSMPEAGGDLAWYFNPESFDEAYQAIRDAIAQPDKVAAAEQRIQHDLKYRAWSEVSDEYFKAIIETRVDSDLLEIKKTSTLSFKELAVSFGDAVGTDLLNRIQQYLTSGLSTQGLHVNDIIAGDLARGAGDWKIPEHWGCWIGYDGADIEFFWDKDETVIAYVSYGIIESFSNQTFQFEINGSVMERKLSTENSIFRLDFNATAGRNIIKVFKNTSPDLRQQSLDVDERGLMLGISEIRIMSPANVAERLDILEYQMIG